MPTYSPFFIRATVFELTLVSLVTISPDANPPLISALKIRLLSSFLNDYQQRVGIEITSVFQSTHDKGSTGYCGFKYIENGKTKEIRSDDFMNECLRMFNLITKLNHTSHLYDFEIFDIMEE